MEFPARFIPPRRTGFLFHAILTVILASAGAGSLWYALQRTEGSIIIGWLLVSIFLLAPLPFLIYRGYALMQARYILDRDGLRVRWGLRSEDIPMPQVEWIRPANELGYRLRLPIFRWPGSLFGKRSTEGLGTVEFLASGQANLQLIATPKKVYAISPDDPRGFLNLFSRAVELGSLAPLSSASVRPAAFFKRIWSDRVARPLVFLGLGATGLLVLITSLLVSTNEQLPLGYNPQGQHFPPGPSQYMLLLPILGAIAYVIDLAGGMFFYRRGVENQLIAYLLWGMGFLTPALLTLAVLLMAR